MNEGSGIEQEIAQLEQQLAQKRAALEETPSPKEKIPSEKELLRQTIGQRLQSYTSPAPAAGAQPAPQTAPLPSDGAQPSYTLPELQAPVQALVNLAFAKSLEEALKEAAKTNNAALIDAFHDVIVDELYSQLLERKKIQQVE
ncbi:MAG: hypothetical protein L0312_28410 [Acidobacteria bacterium]|nr:hypothetical protein [Acidobacteriota bacterium]